MASFRTQSRKRFKCCVGALCFIALTIGGCMNRSDPGPATTAPTSTASAQPQKSPADLANVRYQVANVDRAIAFYTQQLGFKVEQQAGTAFASVVLGELRLLLSGPGSSGARAMPDGRRQEPGGWNRIVLYVDNLTNRIDTLKAAGTRLRNQIEAGPGGTQIQIEDPDGNPIELHEAPARGSK